ncbi:MAG TPA: TonB-dependent receptor [Saprospiraceae bacterium]|nr:TonB-dependent receptor [Saprospiraceae bacterium]
MYRRFWFLFFLNFVWIPFLISQNKISIKGRVTDTLGEPLAVASVFLLNPVDSTLIDYTRAEDDGRFQFNNISKQDYLLKIHYAAFIPFQTLLKPTETKIELGTIKLKPITKELYEVVIKEARAPMSIRGDTIEYDASTFKVPQGSTVEDLLRKLPGIEVAQDGSIKSEGKDVSKVTVEGRTFFGDDPKMATKNLPAEGVKKVQVYDNVTEQQKLTGAGGPSRDKVMNLELKDEFKQGGFGKVIAGVGNVDRFELKGNYNKFNKKWQLSFLGVGNNTGRNGLGWNDYQDFKGSNSFNWNDLADFGFNSSGGGGGRRFIVFNSSDDSDSDELSDNFFGRNSSGFPRRANGGINLNYDVNKSKISGMYFYNYNDLKLSSLVNKTLYTPANNFKILENTNDFWDNNSHQGELRVEQSIDSFQTLVLLTKISSGTKGSDVQKLSSTSLENNDIQNDLNLTTSSLNDIFSFQGSLIYRTKFKKKGRAFAFSGSYLVNNSDRDQTQNSKTQFYLNSKVDSVVSIDQLNVTGNKKQMLKSSALYVEPLLKKFFLESFVNYWNQSTDYIRDVENGQNTGVKDSILSRINDNSNITKRIGSSLRYTYHGINASIGMAYQELSIDGVYKTIYSDLLNESLNIPYRNWVPNASFSYELGRNSWLSANYNVDIIAPTIRNLLPIVDLSNPLQIFTGNPLLQPEKENEISLNFHKFSAANFTNSSVNFNYTNTRNNLSKEMNIDDRGFTSVKPINLGNSDNIFSNARYQFPIIKNKFTVNPSYNVNWSRYPVLINSKEILYNSFSHGPNLRVNLTPIDAFSCFLSSGWNWNQSQYSNNIFPDQNISNWNSSVELNYKFPFKFFINSNFNYSVYENKNQNQKTAIPILNLSIYKVFLKEDKGEIRFSAYDILNKNTSIQQTAGTNFVQESQTSALAQYFMLSFTYNMRGIKTTIKRDRNHWD